MVKGENERLEVDLFKKRKDQKNWVDDRMRKERRTTSIGKHEAQNMKPK